MDKPEISVVMATYNGDKYLIDQLESILAQTLKPSQIVVCDDNSTDNTQSILSDYESKGKLSYYVNAKRLGVINNFKRAVSLASDGNLIAFTDQDDVWLPDKLQKLNEIMVEKIDQSKPGMVYSDAMIIDKKGNMTKKSLWSEFGIHPDKQTFKTLLLRNIVPGSMMLINTKMKNEFMRIPISAYMHDAWITFIAYAYCNYAYVNAPLVKYRQHDNNVTYSVNNAYHSSGLFSKIVEYAKGTVLNTPLFEKELIMAEAFYKTYRNMLSNKDKSDFHDFLLLKNKNYLFKKLHIRHINKTEGS